MFKPYEATPTPVKVYRATDLGAPQLKNESGSLKILLKTCLVNGYGEGTNSKEPAGWQIADETPSQIVLFHDTYGIGLKIENSNASYANIYMVCGERFTQEMTYSNKGYNNFVYNNAYAMKNWLLVACEKGFVLVLPENNLKSQILYFGRISGFYEDMGNVVCINTSWLDKTTWDNGTINGMSWNNSIPVKFPQIMSSQWREGGTLPFSVLECDVLSPFSSVSAKYPDAVYQDMLASAITLVEKNGSPRGVLPGIFWCYHNLQGVIDECQPVDMLDNQKYIKLNLHDAGDPTHCFVLNIEQWEL